MLRRFFSFDAVFVLIVTVVTASVFHLIDLVELCYRITLQNGWWMFDELLYVAAGLFVAGTMLAVRRYYDLKSAIADIKVTELDLKKKTASLDLMREAASLSNEADTAEEALELCLQRICDYAGWNAAYLYFQDKGRIVLAEKGVRYPKDSKVTYGKGWSKNSFAFPVFVDRKMEEAVLEFYTSDEKAADNHIIMIVYNITNQIARVIERQQAEERHRTAEIALREKTKMESLGSLAGGLAHEINNALQPVMGLSESLRERYEDKDDRTVQFMTTIHNNAMHARNIVRDVLAFARKDKKEKRYLGLVELIDEAVLYTDEFLPSGVSVEVIHLSENIGSSQIWADRTGILQIMSNLLKNAAYAMDEKGCVTINLSLDNVQEEASGLDLEPGLYAHIVVADEGCGMDKKALEHLFEPFFTTKPLGIGTGLGLSAVYGIVKDWEGTVSVESRVNEGTQFHLYVPANVMK